MTRSTRALILGVAFLILSVLPFACIVDRAHAADLGPFRAVALSDARIPPARIALVKPGRSVTPRLCRGTYTLQEVSAYQWTGAPMRAQEWRENIPVGGGVGYRWRSPRGQRGAVYFDGLTFFNRTRRTRMIAGWC